MKRTLAILFHSLTVFGCCDSNNEPKKGTTNALEKSVSKSHIDSTITTGSQSIDSVILKIEGGNGKEFVVFYDTLKILVSNNDSEHIANEMFYPLHTALEGQKGTLNIKNQRSFLKYYRLLFNQRMKEFILREDLHDVFSNYQGIALGGGRIWIDQRMVDGEVVTKVSTLSNLDAYWK